MGKKKRSHPNVEDILARPWCFYCERDFEDLKLLISHQKAKHFKCDRCGRRLNTAGGLSVHMNQVHKESLDQVENALPNRSGLDVEIFGMEGIPADALESHRARIVQDFYQAQEDRRIATGNPLPGQGRGGVPRKKIKIEDKEELLRRFREWRELKKAGGVDVMEGVVPTPPAAAQPNHGFAPDGLPGRPPNAQLPPGSSLPQRPGGASDDIDQMIRMAEAGARTRQDEVPPPAEEKKSKKDKDKKGRMVYDDAEFSPEERMAALPRYAFTAA